MEHGRVDISGSHPRGQQDGVQPDGKTHVVCALPADFSSRLWFGSRMFGVLPGSQRTTSQQAAPPVDGRGLRRPVQASPGPEQLWQTLAQKGRHGSLALTLTLL